MIAIVVLTFERVHLLRQCVENVLGRTSPATEEIVIWNNASTDGTREYLDSLTDSRVHVVHHARNIGQNAYAEAVKLTTSPYVIELDDDMIDAPEGWDLTLLHAYERLPKVGFLAANLVNNPHDQAARVMYVERPHEYSTEEVDGITLLRGPVGGGCAITARELLDRVGGFQQRRGRAFWLEDEAYISDIAKHGYEAAYLKDLQLLHAGGDYYAPLAPAKHEYWKALWRREVRKNRVKRFLLRAPLVRGLNERLNLFSISETPDL